MLKDQNFPVSLEIQLLGGLGAGPRTTANLCTPGTHVVYRGTLHTTHCTNSTSKTYDGDQWVRVEVLVHGDDLLRHVVDGQIVLEYSKPQMGGSGVDPVDPAVKVDGTAMTGGYIALQAETAPIDFRKVELLDLEGCTDPRARTYKPYVVKSNPSRCLGVSAVDLRSRPLRGAGGRLAAGAATVRLGLVLPPIRTAARRYQWPTVSGMAADRRAER
jgi:hypothetical protein